jgi:hypothetical protein
MQSVPHHMHKHALGKVTPVICSTAALPLANAADCACRCWQVMQVLQTNYAAQIAATCCAMGMCFSPGYELISLLHAAAAAVVGCCCRLLLLQV